MRLFTTHTPLAVLLVALLLVPAIGPASAGPESPVSVLEVESIGIPGAPGIQPEGREINELFPFGGKLWVGCGDATDNTGPTPVYAVEPKTNEITQEFVVDDEGIYTFRVLDGQLAIPGYDAMEPWEWGNLYVRGESAWTKHRTLPRAIHVVDVCAFQGAWFAGIGASAEYAEGETLALGTVQLSTDKGVSWRTIWSSPADTLSFWRVGSILEFGGRIYAFPYAVGVKPPAMIPPELRDVVGKPLQGMVYLYRPDPMGTADAVCFDGAAWSPVDLVPLENVGRVRPFVFGDRLLISAIHGEYVGAMSKYVEQHRAAPPGMETALHAFDGKTTTRVPLDYEMIRDATVEGDTLVLLVLDRGAWWIVETEDLEMFDWHALPLTRFTPRAVARIGDTTWIGTTEGNLFRTVGAREVDSLDAVHALGPRRITVGGDLPRNAHAGWLAITEFARPWLEASIEGEIAEGKAEIRTSEVAAFRILPPRAALGAGETLSLEIDGQDAFEGPVPEEHALICMRTGDQWTVEAVAGTTYVAKPQMLGACAADLDHAGLARWTSRVLLDAVGGDVVLFPPSTFKKPLPAGLVTSRAILDGMYRNRVATLSATGAEIRAMLDFNEAAEARDRLARYPETDLEDDATYRVITHEYVIEKAERYLGRKVEAEVLEQTVEGLLLKRVAEKGKVE